MKKKADPKFNVLQSKELPLTKLSPFYWKKCNRLIGLVGSVRQWSGRPGFNLRSRHTKDGLLHESEVTDKLISYISYNYLNICKQMPDPIYQPLRSGRIWHKVNF